MRPLPGTSADGSLRTSDRTQDIWGERRPFAAGEAWPRRADLHLASGVRERDVERWVPSACVLCSNGCGLDIAVAGGRVVGVRGRAGDRVNHGRLGPKGLYGWQAGGSADRLTRPLVRRGGRMTEAGWDEAMDVIVSRASDVLEEHGPLAMGFYTSGQLFLEDYYLQTIIARAGIGTPHLDGNTRLCTATAEWALIESFGSDGNPGSYGDVDLADTLFLVGHNVAETQTVLWSRMLDRLHGPDRPRLIVADPRRTPAADLADVHLPVRPGTNVMLLNALLHELIREDRADHAWVGEHTVGYDALASVVKDYPPERAAEVCGVPAERIRAAASLLGTADRLVSTVLQGVYQSHQATAAAVQVNNIHLLRGMIGAPGRTVFQMNGQPTAQNTRETGANGTLPVFLNWQNDEHVAHLARHWHVDPMRIPHWAPPTHAMQMLRYAEQGSLRWLWVTGTNPAVSWPELKRVRSVLGRKDLFLVVSDAFHTETTELADVVLPAAMWGEKTGTFTNADRTVHFSEKAVDPPGEARGDFEALLMFAREIGLRDDEGQPLPRWSTPEEAYDDFRALSRGKLCDYSGLSWDVLREAGGVQWPYPEDTPAAPSEDRRLYTDGRFLTSAEECESYGHDLLTGALYEADQYAANDPGGRAIIKPAEYLPPHETLDEEYPLRLTTGRTVHHWHTRTKTARAPELQAAAPEMWIEIYPEDAADRGISDGDTVRVVSRHGTVQGTARLTGTRQGVVFAPFHYGYFDLDEDDAPENDPRAANEATPTEWDPISKQPVYKVTAVRLEAS
jgi:ferredoxin-nitrate reductase